MTILCFYELTGIEMVTPILCGVMDNLYNIMGWP